MMKSIYTKLISMRRSLVICSSACALVACDDFGAKENNISLDVSNNILEIEEILSFAGNLELIQLDLENKRINQKDAEAQIQIIMEPLIQNGKHLQSQMLNSLSRSGEISKLSLSESISLHNLTEKELAELALLTSFSYSASIDPRIRSCLSAAVGVAAIYDLIENTAALGRVQTTIGALRLIGRRYLGWIGLGLMIADFTDCYYV